VRIFHRKSRWQRLLEDLEYVSKNLDSVPKKPAIKKPAIKGGAAAAVGAAALTAASAAVSSLRRRTNV
jgi:hypothetical protein